MADAIKIREAALEIVMKQNNGGMSIDNLVAEAKKIETFLWGGLQPKPGFKDIQDAADFIKSVLTIESQNPEKSLDVRNAIGYLERFMSESNKIF